MIFFYFLIALSGTIVIESIVTWVFGFHKSKIYKVVFLINVITNLSLNLILFFNSYFGKIIPENLLILTLEVLIIIVEWCLLKYSLSVLSAKLFLLSLAMNLSSFLIGLMLFR